MTEVTGDIHIVDLTTNTVLPTPFLNIADTKRVGEGGLLGLAFHPDYANNGKFYTYVTVDNGGVIVDGQTSPFSSHVREYTVSENDPNVANPVGREILSFAQPAAFHQGGWLSFNPKLSADQEQYLYVSSGDGGHDLADAQQLDNLFGSILRLDVDGDDFAADPNRNYAIPSDNPFVGSGNQEEIWSYGFRNPWRNSFDTQTGDLWIGDVGGGSWEEVNFQPADSTGGENYAWPRREGTNPGFLGGALLPGDVDPVYDFPHRDNENSDIDGQFRGDAVMGGYVYRGPEADEQGTYLFGDNVTGKVWKFDPSDPRGTIERVDNTLTANVGTPNFLVSFGTDAAQNLYWIDFTGEVFRFEAGNLRGDYDNDGDVDQDDYAAFASSYGSTVQLGADGNGDGVINAADYTVWRDAFGNHGSPSAGLSGAVPEPTSVCLLGLLGTLGACGRSRSRR